MEILFPMNMRKKLIYEKFCNDCLTGDTRCFWEQSRNPKGKQIANDGIVPVGGKMH